MGLNHMNGRIEDSVTGRFLSADPRGTIPGNTQSWNRYSYVNNNPLTYIDPSGFDDCTGEAQITCYTPPPDRGIGLTLCGGNCPSGQGSVTTTWINVGGLSLPSSPAIDALYADLGLPFTPTNQDFAAQISNDPAADMAVSLQQVNSADSTALSEIVVTSSPISVAAGMAGMELGFAENLSGTWSIGTNFRVYNVPRGNQYFRTFARFSTIFHYFGAGTLFLGTAADYAEAFETGSYIQANSNAGIGAAGLFTPIFAPLYLLGGSEYFLLSYTYPGGQAVYNQAFFDALNAIGPVY